MEWHWLIATFFAKHFLISNILDLGYSKSRNTKNRHWQLGFWYWATSEMIGTLAIVLYMGSTYNVVVGLAELFVLFIACQMERKTIFQTSLSTHLFSEVFIIFFYTYTVLIYAPRIIMSICF